MMKLSKIKPYLFENYLIIAFSKDWIDIFDEIPQFEVFIDKKKRLVLVGPPIVQKSGDVVRE